jgi:SAM-dependent methyltransferase
MKPEDKAWINDRYDERIGEKGFSIEGLASGTPERRAIRYEVLVDVGIVSGCSVLDVGCGLGDFGSYLRDKGINVAYTGIDINVNLIQECRARYPWGEFLVADIEDEQLGYFDFVVSSSCFNLQLRNDDNYTRMVSVMEAMYRHMSSGMAIDMLSSWVDFRGNSAEAFHYDPAQVFNHAKQITKRVQLRHDYPLFEFCMYLFPDFAGWSTGEAKSDV